MKLSCENIKEFDGVYKNTGKAKRIAGNFNVYQKKEENFLSKHQEKEEIYEKNG